MDISLFKIFTIFGIVSTWAAKALADGKITITEAVELATLLAGILGVTLAVEVPSIEIEPGPEFETHPGPIEEDAASGTKPVEE